MKKIVISAGVCLALVAFLGTASASPIAVGNYSFTSPNLPGYPSNYDPTQTAEEYTLGAPVDWSVTQNASNVYGVTNPVDTMYAGTGGAPGGSDGVLPGTGDGYTVGLMNFGSLGASTTFTYSGASLGNFVIGHTYELKLAIGLRLDEAANTSPTYTIELLSGASVVASNTGLASQGTFTDLVIPSYVATGTGTIGIAIVGTDNSGGFEQANFDNVRLADITEAPEPATWAMMLGGLVFLGLCIRRKGQMVK